MLFCLSKKNFAKNTIDLGQMLALAKECLPHGRFIPMLESIGMNPRTARDYMQLASLKIVSKRQNFADLINFNNSQVEKLDDMPDDEAEKIIATGQFPKSEKPKQTTVKDFTDAVIVTPDEVETLRADNKALKEENRRLHALFEPRDVTERASQLNDEDKALIHAVFDKCQARNTQDIVRATGIASGTISNILSGLKGMGEITRQNLKLYLKRSA